MKTTGVHDPVRGDMMRLPRESAIEASKHIARLKISDDSPWVPQQFIKGREYYTNWLVVNGQVKAFVACLSAEMLMHYEAIPTMSVSQSSDAGVYQDIRGPKWYEFHPPPVFRS